jgi:hypothetical protein
LIPFASLSVSKQSVIDHVCVILAKSKHSSGKCIRALRKRIPGLQDDLIPGQIVNT